MKTIDYKPASTNEYDQWIKDLYAGVRPKVEEVKLPILKVISVDGSEPPGAGQYQTAIACLYGVAYTLKMRLKFNKLPRPEGYFDYKVGGLGSQWWSTDTDSFDISNAQTLHWKAYLVVPDFINEKLFLEAVRQAKAKKPEIPYENVQLEVLNEGRCVQMLHIGPYNQERSSINILQEYIKTAGLKISGRHNEIYISDPRRTAPEKLKTVIRYPVSETSMH